MYSYIDDRQTEYMIYRYGDVEKDFNKYYLMNIYIIFFKNTRILYDCSDQNISMNLSLI